MKEQQPPANDPSLLNQFISLFLRLLFFLLFSLIFSIIIEWIGINFWWSAQHSKTVYHTELNYVLSGLKEGYLDSYQIDFMQKVDSFWRNLAYSLNFPEIEVWLKTQESMINFVTQGFVSIEYYVISAIFTTKTFILRLSILLLSWPAFFIALLVGATDGFVERDLRRFGGGRESASLYLIGKNSIAPLFIGAWVVYLSIPVSVHPNVIIIPFVVFFGLAVKVACERMKKYF